MNTRKLLLLAALGVVLSSSAVDYVVEGRVEGMDGESFRIIDFNTNKTVDSATVSNGKVRFEGEYLKPALVRIESGNVFSVCVLDSVVEVDFDTHAPKSGSTLNIALRTLMEKKREVEQELSQFSDELKAHGFTQPELGEIYSHLYNKLRPELLATYAEYTSYPNAVGEAAVSMLGSLWDLTPDEWDSIYGNMPEYVKELPITENSNLRFTRLRNTTAGNKFVDFTAKNLDGEEVKLSDYVGRGKYVLVDFWASWCGPCREEAETTLRPLYEKYKEDERFEILGVATWDSHDKTVEAIEKYNYPWAHMIDCGMEPMGLYAFNGIPMLILFDPEGIILERDLRGEKLTEKIKSLLNTNN